MEEILLRELFRIPTPLGDFPVFGYGAMVLLGVLSGLWLLRAGARRSKLDPDSLSDLTVMLGAVRDHRRSCLVPDPVP